MMLRPRQQLMVDRGIPALQEHRNTLLIAPTGCGKTIIMGGVGRDYGPDARILALQHRDELLKQNSSKFARVNPNRTTSLVSSGHYDFDASAIFAMVGTLAREETLAKLPPIDLCMVDEAHHTIAKTYQRIIAHLRALNPEVRICGVTATPERSDKRSMGEAFTNCADQITFAEAIANGWIVPPRTYRLDVGQSELLEKVRIVNGEYDMAQVEEIMNIEWIHNAVVDNWFISACGRSTVAFCATVKHAHATAEAFRERGIPAETIDGNMGKRARGAVLDRFERGETLVLTNAFVLTEGWDSPRCSCVALLRPSSAKGTMIQMIGRGVRLVETGMYSNEIFKTDCVVLDFGNTTKKHGSLEQDVVLKPYRKGKGVAPMRKCPQCGFHCHATIEACPSCGHVFEATPTATIDDMKLSEIDPTEFSPFRWEYLNERCIAANGLTASVVVAESGGMWHAFGQSEKTGPHYQTLISSAKAVAIASADAFLQQHGDDLKFAKTRAWLSMPPTQEQLKRLPAIAHQDPKLNRYRASLYVALELGKPRLEAALRERRRQIAA